MTLTRIPLRLPAIAIIVALALLAFRSPALLSAWLVNRASHQIGPAWRARFTAPAFPQCPIGIGTSDAAPLAAAALSLNAENERAWVLRGRESWLRGACDDAAAAWAQAAALAREDQVARLERANALYATGDPAAAMSEYRSLRTEVLFWQRARLAASLGDPPSALRWNELSAEVRPTRQAVEALVAEYLRDPVRQGQVAAAWTRLAEATVETAPEHWWALGQAAEVQQQWADALAAYTQGSGLDQPAYGRYEFVFRAGVASQQVGQFAQARHYYELAMQINPQSVWTPLMLGDLAERQGDVTGAGQWYQQARLVDPRSEWPLYYSGRLLWSQGDLEQATTLLSAAAEMNPSNAAPEHLLALMARQAGDSAGAIRHLERAVLLVQGANPDWQVLLGDLYAEGQRCAEARQAYQRALDWQPGWDTAARKLEELKGICR
jgi:tetratricopeptide (TPR) repeat protein